MHSYLLRNTVDKMEEDKSASKESHTLVTVNEDIQNENDGTVPETKHTKKATICQTIFQTIHRKLSLRQKGATPLEWKMVILIFLSLVCVFELFMPGVDLGGGVAIALAPTFGRE